MHKYEFCKCKKKNYQYFFANAFLCNASAADSNSALELWIQPCFSLILSVSESLTLHLSLSLSDSDAV